MILEEEREKEDQLASKDRDFQEPQLSKASRSVYGVFPVKAIAWPLHTVLHVCKISYCTRSVYLFSCTMQYNPDIYIDVYAPKPRATPNTCSAASILGSGINPQRTLAGCHKAPTKHPTPTHTRRPAHNEGHKEATPRKHKNQKKKVVSWTLVRSSC